MTTQIQAKATFDVTTKEGKMRVFNAKSGASVSLKNLPDGTVINAVGLLVYSDVIDSYGKPQEVTVTNIFDSEGVSYSGVSDTIAKATENLIDLVNDIGLEVFPVKIVKAQSRAGNEFLNLQLVM